MNALCVCFIKYILGEKKKRVPEKILYVSASVEALRKIHTEIESKAYLYLD